MPETNKILVIDCQTAGIAGDMLLGALIDLGAGANRIFSAIQSLGNPAYGYKNVKTTVEQVTRKGFKATKIDTTAENTTRKSSSELIAPIEETAKKLKLSSKAQQFASKAIRTLVEAEMKIHGNTLGDAHLHEVGLVDTPAEIIGTAVALENLELFDAKIYTTPVSVGGGLFKFSHGTVSSPAPATLEILRTKNYPLKGGPVESELTTPTGAAMLVNLADEVIRFYPEMIPQSIGYGAGNKNFEETANVLRLTVGAALDSWVLKDEIAILETNLDDVTGEVVGRAIDVLLREGAKDVSIVPMFTKKNRPGQILKIVADRKDGARLARVIIEETGTLGVRVCPCERHIINREVISVDVPVNGVNEQVKVKVARDGNGEIIRIKPEYEDVKRLSDKMGKPLREINEIALMRAREVLLKR
jgi:uncharacterized protein (TIGR00299 family) protein